MSDILSLVCQTARFSTECYSQLQSLNYIRENFTDHYYTYEVSLINLENAFKKLTDVFEEDNGRKRHTELFKHKILSASIINTISIEFTPTHDFIIELGKIFNNNYSNLTCKNKIYYIAKQFIQTPTRLKAKLEKNIKKITKILSQVIELNKHIFGTANRIEHPILRKTWMLVGENQINDSAIPVNLFQENLFVLLKYELLFDIKTKENEINMIENNIEINSNNITDEEFITKREAIFKIESDIYKLNSKLFNLHINWRERIETVINNIDDASTTTKDGFLSVSELNQIPEELFDYNTAEEFINEYVSIIKNTNVKKTEKKKKRKLKYYKKKKLINDIKMRKGSIQKEGSLMNSFMSMINKKNSVVPLLNQQEDDIISQDSTDSLDDELEYNDELIGLASLKNVFEKINEIIIVKNNLTIIAESQKCNIDFKHKERLPNGKGYGSDFPAKLVCEYFIPLKINETNEKLKEHYDEYEIDSITFECKAFDQGWGGTNHSHVRYQINDTNCITAFFINNNQETNEKNKYSFTINNIQYEDKICIWLLCPTWPGWEAHIQNIVPIIKYKTV